MGAELSILLDIRRIKQGGVYPLKLRVYYGGKTDLHTIKSLLFQGRIGNASAYQSSYTSLKMFRGNVRFLQVTSQYLKEYEAWMISVQGNSKTTVGIYTRALRTIFNEAIELKLISNDHYPFSRRKYGIPTGRNIKKALDQHSISKLYYTLTEKKNEEKSKGLLVL